jgi:hypothetical protein
VKDRCEDEISLKWPARQAAGRPKKTAPPAPPRIPRITRRMALAIKFQEMIDRGEVKDYADLARLGFVTRARLTQIMYLTLLAPEIQEQILLSGTDQPCSVPTPEPQIRQIASEVNWNSQKRLWTRSGK